jgi:hypothetical protein
MSQAKQQHGIGPYAIHQTALYSPGHGKGAVVPLKGIFFSGP